jgi:RNA polymerase sigma-70 factor, ECF subfamily
MTDRVAHSRPTEHSCPPMGRQPSLHLEGTGSLTRSASAPSDAELLAHLRASDVTALDLILQRYWGPVVAYLVRLTRTGDAAEDVAQRTFLRLWERRTSWQQDGSLRALLYRVARNFAISDRRRDGAAARFVATAVLDLHPAPTPIQLLENQQLRRELERAIQSLPERRREVFILRCVHDLSYKEIAEVMETSTQTVANQLSSALSTLRGRLGHLLD